MTCNADRARCKMCSGLLDGATPEAGEDEVADDLRTLARNS